MKNRDFSAIFGGLRKLPNYLEMNKIILPRFYLLILTNKPEFVIDFASLVFHCVDSAITNKGGVLRTQQKQREITFKYT